MVNQRKTATAAAATPQLITQTTTTTQQVTNSPQITKTVRVIPKVQSSAGAGAGAVHVPIQQHQKKIQISNPIAINEVSRTQEIRGRTVKVEPTKTITAGAAQNTHVRGRTAVPQNVAQRRIASQQVQETVVSSEEDIETEVIDSSMVEVQIESSNSPKPPLSKKIRTIPPANSKLATTTSTPTPKSSIIKTEADNADDSLKCDLCNKEFHSLRQRQRHRITHLEQNKILNCKKCDKAYLDRNELLAHERTQHSGASAKGRKSSESAGGGGGHKRKHSQVTEEEEEEQEHEEEEQVLMEMTVTEEEVIHDDIYVHEEV